MSRIGRERGWPPMSRAQFDADRGPRGHLLLGSPQEVIDKMIFEHGVFNYDRFLIQFSVGTIPHDRMMHCIELYGTKVAPAVRKATAGGMKLFEPYHARETWRCPTASSWLP